MDDNEIKKHFAELIMRLEIAEKTLKALIIAQKEQETYTGDEFMPEGEYYGNKF